MKRFKYLMMLLACMMSTLLTAEESQPLFIVHFETGPAWQEGVAPNQQKGFGDHASNLQALRKSGTIKFGARYQQYGMIFISEKSIDAATKLLDADPGVKSGLFKYRIAPMNVFYGWE